MSRELARALLVPHWLMAASRLKGAGCRASAVAISLDASHTSEMSKSRKKSVRSCATPVEELTPSDTCIRDRNRFLEREVELGLRDARSLIAIPAEMARAAKVVFPEDAFGTPEPW